MHHSNTEALFCKARQPVDIVASSRLSQPPVLIAFNTGPGKIELATAHLTPSKAWSCPKCKFKHQKFVGAGYCITQELQAHSQGCAATAGQGQLCLPRELCFHEVRQRGRHLLQDSSKSRLTIVNRSGYNLNADEDLLVTIRGDVEKKLNFEDLQADRGICVGIR